MNERRPKATSDQPRRAKWWASAVLGTIVMVSSVALLGGNQEPEFTAVGTAPRTRANGLQTNLDDSFAVDIVPSPTASSDLAYSAYRKSLTAQYGNTRPILQIDRHGIDAVGQQTRLKDDPLAVVSAEDSTLVWEFTVPEEGWYAIELEYLPMDGHGVPIEREILIDGVRPFAEARSIRFSRVWTDRDPLTRRDASGNDLRPRQKEVQLWQTVFLQDSEGYHSEPFHFFIREGSTTVTLRAIREPFAVRRLSIRQIDPVLPYRDQYRKWAQYGLLPADVAPIRIQAETAIRKSDASLYPIFDRTTPGTEPNHPYQIRLNTIGGTNWRFPGQWIEWDVEVPKDGLYELILRVRQDQVRGVPSVRTLRVNGSVPFTEAQHLEFEFSRNWRIVRLGTQLEPYLVPLVAGRNTVRLEVSLGPLSDIVRTVEQSVFRLNRLYRSIVMITGPVPDPFRDYQLERQIPFLMDSLMAEYQLLSAVLQELRSSSGEMGGHLSVLQRISRQLQDMVGRPETIANRLDTFMVNIGSLGAWVFEVRQLPLEIDYLQVQSPGTDPPPADQPWWRRVSFRSAAFVASFFVDFDAIASSYDENTHIEVWLATGRQQAQILRGLIDDSFTPETGIGVILRIVDQQIVLPSILSRRGPDVVLNQRRANPVDFALRGAVMDLSSFSDFPEVASRFPDSSLIPFQWGDGVFALPETLLFDVMFVRDDIVGELGLRVPETWEEVFDIIPELQRRNLTFGMPMVHFSGGDLNVQPINSAFAMLLFQNGGEFYSSDASASALGQRASVDAFTKWTRFYTSFRLPLEYALQQQFRTGEIPFAIGYFNFFNALTVFAPEIRGLWRIVPVPGHRRPNGELDRSVSAESTAGVMLSNTGRPNEAWEFLKWWTSTPTQIAYGREMETVLGPAARFPTANTDALRSLGWPRDVLQSLQEQLPNVRGIPEIPGGYFTGRHLENAFRSVVFQGGNPRETLLDFVELIDEEIRIRRGEFGIE